MPNRLPNIHILGIQGSGKGTQSALLVEKYGLTYLASGNVFRERSRVDDALGRSIAAQMQAGRLLPLEILLRTVQDFLATKPVPVGLLGDGVIRTMAQYTALRPVWEDHGLEDPLLVFLRLPEELALERIAHRQATQIAGSHRPEFLQVYGGKIAHRKDDNPLAIRERFRLFHEMTEPVVREFEQANRCIAINADQAVDDIHLQITRELEARYPAFRQEAAA
jgi:adenylate kinase